MPPTVKSLEERIDQIASDLEELTHQTVANNTKLDLLSSQLATLVANQSATQNQLAVVVVKLDGVIDQLKSTNARIDSTNARIDAAIGKLDTLTTDHVAVKSKSESIETRAVETASKLEAVATEHVALKAKADTTFAMMRWIGVSAFGVLVTVIISGFAVSRFAGNLEAAVQQQQKTLEEIKRDVSEIRNKK